LAGTLTWLQAADILGIDPRSLRRWRARYQADGVLGLYDRRQLPSPRKAPIAEVQHALRLYRERYRGWNVRHFYRFARRDHALRLSYSFVKLALQEAGLVRKGRARGRHRRRREPRACFGELLHLDGSPHAWLARCPTERRPEDDLFERFFGHRARLRLEAVGIEHVAHTRVDDPVELAGLVGHRA
jgi:Winged helix-turn helix